MLGELLTVAGLDIPANSTALVKGVSGKLASSEPSLTHDFLSEFFIGWERLSSRERPLGILYMSPWLSNIVKHVLCAECDSEKGREKTAAIARKLVETAIQAPDCNVCFQTHVWPIVARDELLVEILLDEMIKIAFDFGPDSEQTAAIASIAASIGTMSIKGRIISRLRKVLNRTSLRPTQELLDTAVWDEVRVLLRMCLESSFDSRGQSQLFLPELFHVATMTLHAGSPSTSASVHNILINTVHSLCTTFPLGDAKLTRLKTILFSLTEPKIELLFDLHRVTEGKDSKSSSKSMADPTMFSHLESITTLLQTVIELGAPSQTLANMWRSRWMGLVASTAFQSNPAIQPKAFTVMGCLASENVDDDLLYQVLVALRTGISRFLEDGDSELLIAIINTLTKMVANLSPTSRYVKQLLWLGTSLVRLVPQALFQCAASLLVAVVKVLAVRGAFADSQMATVLLQGRVTAERLLAELDDRVEVRFTPHTFHIALTVCLIKGLTDSTTQATTMRIFSTLLEIASLSVPTDQRHATDLAVLPYILVLGTRATTVEERREIMWLARRASQVGPPSPSNLWAMVEVDHLSDTELVCNVVPLIINFGRTEELVQQQTLLFLLRLANRRPSVALLM